MALLPGRQREKAGQVSELLVNREGGRTMARGVTQGLQIQSSLKMPNGGFESGSHGALLLTSVALRAGFPTDFCETFFFIGFNNLFHYIIYYYLIAM